MGVNAPIYVVTLIAHVGAGLIGYGSNAFAGWMAKDMIEDRESASGKQFFTGGVALSQRVVFLVPVFGIALLIMRNLSDVDKLWFLGAVAIWTATIALFMASSWPAQNRVGKVLASAELTEELESDLRKIYRDQRIVVLGYLVAFYLMLFKP
jgi:hypothetical protein